MKSKSSNIIFIAIVVILIIILWFIPTGYEKPEMTKNSYRVKAEILEVDNSDLSVVGIVTRGTQTVKMEILSGKYDGEIVVGENVLMGQLKIDKKFKVGDKVLAVIKINEGKIISARADDLYRINVELFLFGLFALFLVGFAKWTGLKALVSFVFTALAIWKVLIPLFLKGYPPLLISFLIVSFTTTIIILLISGFNKKGFVALSGSIAGIGITSIMSIIFGHFFRIPGTVQEFSEILLFTGLPNLNLSDMFLSGIFISAAGAVMDVAMDISASQNELISKKRGMKSKELIKSGFNIAYPVIGTMTTTLLFAYSGSFTFIFMVFMAKGTPMISIFNTNYISAEILHTLVGSFGLVLVAPITSIIGGYAYTNIKKKS